MKRFVAIFLAGGIALFAQTNRGGISGTVTDASQAVISGATVTITNEGTNETRKLMTSQLGTYSAVDLEPVSYRVEVELAGFKKSVVEHVKVDTASTTTMNVTLQAGSIDTKITITADAPAVNVDSGTTSATITERQIEDAPLSNRSVLDLAMTLPNVSGDAGTENPDIVSVTTCPGCNISVNGGRPMSTMIMADGTNNTGVSLARTMVSFSPETVQEFVVQSSVYSAEYSNTGGGVINATTKSGSNAFHGGALWFNRNPDFAAAPYSIATANRPVPTLKYNQFSVYAGGPVWIPKVYNGKNKTFWFAAYEPFYRRNHLDQYGLLPTDGMRQGDFSGLVNTPSGWLPQSVVNQFKSIAPNAVTANDSVIYSQYNQVGNQFTPATPPTGGATFLPFPGNAIPKTMLDSSAQKALQFLIPANSYYLNSNGLISNVFAPRRLIQDEKRYTVRIDQVISDKNRIYGRFTATPIVKLQDTPISPTAAGAEYSWAKQVMLADTHTISPTLFNDLRLNYTRGRFSNTVAPQYDANTGQNINTLLGLPNITKGGVPGLNGLFPGSSLGGGGSTATGIGGGGSTQVEDREERYAITDIVYKNVGTMSLKFGVDMSHALQNVIPLFAALGGQYAFAATQTNSNGGTSGTGGAPFASFMLGVPNGNVTLRATQIPYYYRWNAAAGFIQDDWKVKPNLTLGLGLRYNVELPRTEKYDNQGVFRPELAQKVQLASPLTLQDGEVITSTLVPPFAFSGRGGNARYLTPPDYKDFEPRLSFAWSPGFLREHHLTLRGGYGLSHAPIGGFTRLPNPDFGATANFASAVPSSTASPSNVMRLGENPPVITGQTPAQAIGAPANGLVYSNSLFYQTIGAYAVSPGFHTPYVQNWNMTSTWSLNPTTTIEFSYVGAKGTHLFEPPENINPKDFNLLTSQIAANVNSNNTTADPLGRTSPSGARLTVQNGSLGSQYLGFSSLNVFMDSSANSIRHAGYVSVFHRVTRGLTFSANYTYAKSIDDSSSAYGDKNILTAVNGQVAGQVAFGGARSLDRSVSTFDQRHVVNGTYLYDLPFGNGRRFLNRAWKPLDFIAGGWTTSGIIRFSSGFPFIPVISDTNLLGDITHTVRPNVNLGAPTVNPQFSMSCPVGNNCQPYINPMLFTRPALGQLGNAPRTLDGARGPWNQIFDVSVQKTFHIRERYRIQFRVDAFNALNHPVFRVYPNNAGGNADFMGPPNTTPLNNADYDLWARANSQPLSTTPAGQANITQINNLVATQRNGAGVLPPNFFSVPLPQNFWSTQPGSFDITSLQGYKYFRLRQAYNAGFGQLYNNGLPRSLQFGLKFYF